MKITEYVAKYDPQNQFDVLINTFEQIEYAWNNKFDLSNLKNNFNSVIVSGLGGSAISADLMQNFLKDELKIPFIVNRNYYLPQFAGINTLVIISSYSGNTEETNAVFELALERGCSIVCITTGGRAGKLAEENNVPVVKLKPGYQPRYSLGISFFSLLKVMQDLKLIGNQDEAVKKVKELWAKNGKIFSEENNPALKYAEEILGFIPVIYSAADITSAVGYRFKCQFNENSKLHAFHNILPEMNHNEIIGWESFSDIQFNAKLINILDKDYHPQIKRRFLITSELAANQKAELINLESSEENFKVRIMDLIYLCDWITYYTALLRGFDPSEIDNINYLKEKLAK